MQDLHEKVGVGDCQRIEEEVTSRCSHSLMADIQVIDHSKSPIGPKLSSAPGMRALAVRGEADRVRRRQDPAADNGRR